MGQFTDIMALGCIIITMAALLVENFIEERREKKDEDEQD